MKVPPGGWGHNNELHPLAKIDRRESRRIYRQRNGWDLSWIIVIGIILSVVIAGVLRNKGLL